METINHTGRFEQSIHGFIEQLLRLLMKGKTISEKIRKLKGKLKLLDENNPEFARKLSNIGDYVQMAMYCVVLSLCMLVDYALTFNGLTLLTNKAELPLLKVCVPVFLVFAEISLSYFAINKRNSGQHMPWLYRNLQYLVIAILIAFSFTAIFYTGQGYNKQIDGSSLGGYLFGAVITQIILLIPSIMLHLWIIKNAEDITEAISNVRYKVHRKILVFRIDALESKQKKKQNIFVEWAHNLVQQMEAFKRRHGGDANLFSSVMPRVLIVSINMAMGRKIFDEPEENNSRETKNDVYEP